MVQCGPRAVMLCLLAVMPTASTAQPARADFERGVIALHNFEYEEANDAFVRARKADPAFAMAYWGEAMTFHQTLWRNEDLEAGRRALARLGPTPAARAARAATPTERGWLEAADLLFGNGDVDSRRRAHAERLGRLYASSPEDPDVASFYALALLGTTSRSLIGYGGGPHEAHSAGLAGSDTQRQVAGILDAVLASHPTHAGALHYLLHNYDDPAHASLGLQAARAYAKVASASSHALHMPAHIFVQMGNWSEAAESDRAAFAASEAWVKAKGLGPAMRSYHSLAWLQYEQLQLGQFQQARAALDELAPVVTADRTNLTLLSDLSSMRARYVVETRRWDMLANERNFGNVNELYAIGASAARTGNTALADLARQGLAARSQAKEEGDLRPAIAIMEREVAALIELATGRREQAVQTLTSAVDAELRLPPPLGLPVPVKPAPELLGEVLVEIGRPADALERFRQSLARNPNRSLSQLGLARALTALGQLDTAREHYRQVAANYEHADAELAEAREARAALEGTLAPPLSRPAMRIGLMAGGILALLGVTVLLWRNRRDAGTAVRVPSQRGERRRKARGR